MILRTIRVSGWRCFANAIAVGPFNEGLNVIHAPNATGKSTLFDAMLRGLIDGHRVGGKDIEAIRPWGRPLAPTVHVEFTHDGHEYMISKKFLDSPQSKLARKENGRYVSLAEGGKADEMVREMINGSPPARGLSKPEHWGLAQVLWVPQGELAFKGLSGNLMDEIRSSLGAQVTGPAGNPIERKIEEAYFRIYTSTGKYRTGKDGAILIQLKEQLQTALKERNAAIVRQREYEEAIRKVEDLRARQQYARNQAETLYKELKEARSKAETFQKLASERDQRAERVKAEEARHNEQKARIDTIAGTRKELAGAVEALHKIEENLPLQERELKQYEKAAAEAKSALEDIRKDRSKVDAARELADKARQFTDNAKNLAGLEALVQHITTTWEGIERYGKELAELAAPDEKVLRAVRETIKKRDEAKLRIEASLINLEIVPYTDGKISVLSGENPGELDLLSGIPTKISDSPEVVVDIPSLFRIRASGPSGSIKEHRTALIRAEAELDKLTRSFGTSNIEALEALLQRKRDLELTVKSLQIQVDTWLSGRTLEQIQKQCSEIRAFQAKVIEDYPEWQSELPDPAVLKETAEDILTSFKTRIDKTEAEWYAAQAALLEAGRIKDRMSSQAEAAGKVKESLETRLAGLINDGVTDEERAERLKKAILAWDAARLNLEEISKQLSEFKDNPIETVSRLEKQHQSAVEAAGKSRDDEMTEEGKVQSLSSQGTYSVLTEAEEKAASLQDEIANEELHAGAIRLLYDTLNECRNETLSAVYGPVETVATQIFQRIAGGRMSGLKLGESFEAANVIPEISGEAVSLDSVSGGEREQIYLATRLALAEVLAKEERQMVVLDDVMTFTDAGRMARVMTILEEEAERLQVIILTCHPERYRGLEKANFVDLASIIDNS